jgi:threonine/homoserine/homoserine lactone efflux protein
MLEGITAGFIFSLTLFPGTVWLAKVGVVGTKQQVAAVGFAFWLSHFFWLFIAVPGLMMMYAHLPFVRLGMHLFAAFVLVYMAFKFFRSKRVERIDDAIELTRPWVMFNTALNQSLAMPMRLPAAMAILLATGVYINNTPDWATVPSVLLGALIGVTWWWGQFTLLAAFFAKRVSHPITIKSLNKIRPFCAALCLCLSGIVLFLGV